MLLHLIAALAALPLPDVTAGVAVTGLSLALASIAWPLLRPGEPKVARAQTCFPRDPLTGLARQWAVTTGRLEDGIARQRHAVQLHRKATVAVGALDFEFDLLLRDLRAVLVSPAAVAAA